MDLGEINQEIEMKHLEVSDDMDWFHLALDRNQWKAVMNLRVP
jgi:hypothetical protein